MLLFGVWSSELGVGSLGFGVSFTNSPFSHSIILSFNHSPIQSFSHSFIPDKRFHAENAKKKIRKERKIVIVRSWGFGVRSFIHQFPHSPILPFNNSLIHSFIHSFIHSIIQSFSHSLILSFIHSFFLSLINKNPCRSCLFACYIFYNINSAYRIKSNNR